MSRAAIALGALVACLVSAGGAGAYCYRLGMAAKTAEQDAATVKTLTGVIDSSKTLIADANAASRGMRQAISMRTATDAAATKGITDALALSKDSRAGCVFPPAVMHGLAEARDRAAAAAAGGIRGDVPGPAATPAIDR